VNPDFAKRVGLGERAADLLGYEMHPSRTVKDDDWQTLVSAPTAYTFEIMNRLSAAFGIEYRYPFFDRRLVEFCFGLPSEQKLYRGWTRIVMRRAMEGILPDAIRWRGNKTYNDLNITHGLKRFEAEELHSRIVERSEIIEPYADIPALQKAYRDFMKKPDYVSTTSVWQMAMLSRWLESSKLEI
jgi:asparagine synthase (glutamine-hydrolysing)